MGVGAVLFFSASSIPHLLGVLKTASPKGHQRDLLCLKGGRMPQGGLFGLSDHLMPLSAFGDPLGEPAWIVHFEVIRPATVAALAYRAMPANSTEDYSF